MSEMLKLYVHGGFDFVDDETGFTTSDFGVSENAYKERVTDTSLPAYEQEIEFVKESIELGAYKSSAQLVQAATEMTDVESVEYTGDLDIGYYGTYITATSPYGQSTKGMTEIGIGFVIIVKVKNRDDANTPNIAFEVVKFFKNDLSKRLNTSIDNITVETRYI